ncbi:MAG: hypothetical protein ACW97X_00025 [Candidatus Hodarchaeales archaeon]
MLKFQVLAGALWTEFDNIRGSIPTVWVPESLSDDLLFSVSLRGMSVFSNRPDRRISYSKMFATIPFPEYEVVSISTVLYEASDSTDSGFGVNLVSILIPQFLMESAWIDLRQIQAVFQQYFEVYSGEPILDKKRVIQEVSYVIDSILRKKLEVISEGEKIREHLSKYLESYLVSSMNSGEQHIVRMRIKTLLILLDRVLEAGNLDRIQRSLEKMSFILEQELSDEIIAMYQNSLAQLIQF